jgi:hypothetical protein
MDLPVSSDLSNLNLFGIDGSNQRVERGSFYFILARASIVNFKYSTSGLKPYFYTKNLNTSAVTWVDGNVFDESVLLQTQLLTTKSEESYNVLHHLNSKSALPFLVRYDPEKSNKSPSSHALGWAVKFQQALELAILKEVNIDGRAICIKDGPLFSTSVSIADILDGLSPTFAWKDKVLVACSKRIKDSTLLIEALLKNLDLRNYWFRGQNITDGTLKAIATDSILLPRILRPGQRTPFMLAVPVSRQKVVLQEPRLEPLSCYYLSRHRPHTYIRLEVPKFMWERDRQQVENALKIVAWQHELGHRAPLVQLTADQRCQLTSEKVILEKQTAAALFRNHLEFPEEY